MANSSHSRISPKKPREGALPPPAPEVIADVLGVDDIMVDWLAGDGSDRCYYRISSPEILGTHVLMQLSGADAKALAEDGYDWVRIADLLGRRGIFIPKVIATIPEHAALIIEDYGNDMLEGIVWRHAENGDWEPVKDLYGQCHEILSRFLTIKPRPGATWARRAFDVDRFVWELDFFLSKYGGPVAGISLTGPEKTIWNQEVRRLGEELAEHGDYFVHRDFHSRNLLHLQGRLAVIDFQDARLGPAAYDLVSLCFDSYVPFSGDMRRALLEDGIRLIGDQRGRDVRKELESSWKAMLLQRQLKAIGSFGFLTHDKKRGDYLKYVDPAVQTMEEQDLGDDRWPLLSRDILLRLRASL